MVGGHADVGGALLDHFQYRIEHAQHRATGPILALVEATQAVEVPEELVCAVNEVNNHGASTVASEACCPARSLAATRSASAMTRRMFSPASLAMSESLQPRFISSINRAG